MTTRPSPSLDDFDTTTRDIFMAVCVDGPCHSSVTLWHDLVDAHLMTSFGDGLGLIENILADLNAQGLIVYALGHTDVGGPYIDDTEQARHDKLDVFTRIRATQAGYECAGMASKARQVGVVRYDRSDEVPTNPGDATDFRTLKTSTWGGSIERMDLREHVYAYWDHAELHFEQLWERDALVAQKQETRHE